MILFVNSICILADIYEDIVLLDSKLGVWLYGLYYGMQKQSWQLNVKVRSIILKAMTGSFIIWKVYACRGWKTQRKCLKTQMTYDKHI